MSSYRCFGVPSKYPNFQGSVLCCGAIRELAVRGSSAFCYQKAFPSVILANLFKVLAQHGLFGAPCLFGLSASLAAAVCLFCCEGVPLLSGLGLGYLATSRGRAMFCCVASEGAPLELLAYRLYWRVTRFVPASPVWSHDRSQSSNAPDRCRGLLVLGFSERST